MDFEIFNHFLKYSLKLYFQAIPFSAGRRSCIGRHFAYQELKIVVCRIASQIRIKNELLKKGHDGYRPVKACSFTWKTARDALKQSFAAKVI